MQELTQEEINALRILVSDKIKAEKDITVDYKKLVSLSNKLFIMENNANLQISSPH